MLLIQFAWGGIIAKLFISRILLLSSCPFPIFIFFQYALNMLLGNSFSQVTNLLPLSMEKARP